MTEQLRPEDLIRLQARLDALVALRPEIAVDLADAKSDGAEILENASFLAAKERQAQVEESIWILSERIRNAQVVTTVDEGVVGIGSRVRIALDGVEREWHIVGTDADVKSGEISARSPMAKALMGATAGDERQVRTPRGERTVRVLELL